MKNLYKTSGVVLKIKIEYLVAYALKVIYEIRHDKKVSLDLLVEFGNKLASHMQEKYPEYKIILIWSNVYMDEFLREYKGVFEGDGENLVLKECVEIEYVQKHILNFTPFEVLENMIYVFYDVWKNYNEKK